jgi:uracil-DNA glycosylase family 4
MICNSCNLALNRRKIVNGEGVKGEIMMVGEAPGYFEDKEGKPFVGRAGKHLDLYFDIFNISREKNLYITNVTKCKPPYNREPDYNEAMICSNLYLSKEIIEVKPKILVCIGRIAASTIFNNWNITVGKYRLRWYGKNSNICIIYHPAYAVRNLNFKREGIELNKELFDDISFVMNRYYQI